MFCGGAASASSGYIYFRRNHRTKIMQGLLETSQDFYLWDNSTTRQPSRLSAAFCSTWQLEIPTLEPENNWTWLNGCRNPIKFAQ